MCKTEGGESAPTNATNAIQPMQPMQHSQCNQFNANNASNMWDRGQTILGGESAAALSSGLPAPLHKAPSPPPLPQKSVQNYIDNNANTTNNKNCENVIFLQQI